MDKDNVFCSSKFWMNDGDKLHVIIKDLVGTMPTIELYDEDGNAEDDYIPPVPPPYEEIKYGALYNWYVVDDVREITSAGWHVPTNAEKDTLINYLGGWDVAGGKLKETGTTYWSTPNSGATNEVSFNGRGAGKRSDIDGIYGKLNEDLILWTSESFGVPIISLYYNTDNSPTGWSAAKKSGCSVRPIKDSTTLSHGETGTYTDPSGDIYRTICIGTQEWVADNIKTEHYRNGDAIPIVTDAGAWAALVTGAMCYYNNDESYA